MSVFRLEDKSEIRRRLEKDRAWSLYALADLDDEMFEHCRWWGGGGDSLALVFRALSIRPIFVIGDGAQTRELLAALDAEPIGYLNLQPHQLEAAAGLYAYREWHRMHRMLVRDFQPRAGDVVTLGPGDRAGVERLYATGDGGGLAFAPFQLATGAFRGIRGRGGELVAVAGVHVLSRNESVAGVGNIFTHPDHRGRGYAQIVTSAVVGALRQQGIATIGLNVEHDNIAAIRAYERIGFGSNFHYFEGVADRVGANSSVRESENPGNMGETSESPATAVKSVPGP